MSNLSTCEFPCAHVATIESGGVAVHYRTDRLLADERDTTRVVEALAARGIAATVRDGRELECPGLDVVALTDPVAQPLHELVRELRAEDGLRVDVEHVFGIRSHIHVWPGGLVRGGDPMEVPPPEGPGAGVRVAIIDTGLAPHEYFADRRLDGSDEEIPAAVQGVLSPIFGHGTFVASVVRQLAPGAHLLGLQLPFDGVCVTDSQMCAVVDKARMREPDILVLAWGFYTIEGAPPPGLKRALGDLMEALPGTVVVAAAGNDGKTVPAWPAVLRGVVGVGAVDRSGAPANRVADRKPPDQWATNRGGWIDMGSVGVAVRGAFPPPPDAALRHCTGDSAADLASGYAVWEGTSMATAAIAGGIAASMQRGDTGQQGLFRLREGDGRWVRHIGFVPKLDVATAPTPRKEIP